MILQRYRTIVAYTMSVWFMLLVISGAIFTHKEVTSTGEIVIHNHPYDFTKKGEKHHHSDDEIHFLDVVFCNTYTPTEFVSYEPVIRSVFQWEYTTAYTESVFHREHFTNYLRGPPVFC